MAPNTVTPNSSLPPGRGWLRRALPDGRVQGVVGLGMFAILIAGVGAVRGAVMEPFEVPSDSMTPTVLHGDHVLVLKNRYALAPGIRGGLVRWEQPRRGEVVVFHIHGINYIKRVVAIGGDRVQVTGDRLLVNGQPVRESTEPEPVDVVLSDCTTRSFLQHRERGDAGVYTTAHDPMGPPGRDMPLVTIPQGTVFVLGDNRDNSEDSRRWGPIGVDQVLGRAEYVWVSLDSCGTHGAFRTDRIAQRVHNP